MKGGREGGLRVEEREREKRLHVQSLMLSFLPIIGRKSTKAKQKVNTEMC